MLKIVLKLFQAYVPVKPNVELKLSEEKNKLLSPNGSGPSDVVYGQEVGSTKRQKQLS